MYLYNGDGIINFLGILEQNITTISNGIKVSGLMLCV